MNFASTCNWCCLSIPLQLQEYVKDLVEIHGKVEQNNRVKCNNYVLFAPENAQNFGMEFLTDDICYIIGFWSGQQIIAR